MTSLPCFDVIAMTSLPCCYVIDVIFSTLLTSLRRLRRHRLSKTSGNDVIITMLLRHNLCKTRVDDVITCL
jgi:hypothetical protein